MCTVAPDDFRCGAALRAEFGNRAFKRRLVLNSQAQAALIIQADEVIASAEYGPVDELPSIDHRRQWEEATQLPDYRITCLFVDRR